MKRLLLLAVILLSVAACAQSNVAVWGVTYTPLAASQPTVDNGSATYNNDVTITVTNEPSGGATCYTYTTDGSTPADPTAATAGTCDDNTYSSGSKPVVTITGTKYKFLNTKSGETNSTVLGPLTYTLTVLPPTPSTASGYSGAALTGFTLTPNTTSASTVYTVDGTTTPNCSGTGTTYSGPFNITTNTTLKDIGCKSNYNPSSVTTRTYTISAASIAYVNGGISANINPGTTKATGSFDVSAGNLLYCAVVYDGSCSLTVTLSDTADTNTAKFTQINNQAMGTHACVTQFYAKNTAAKTGDVITAYFGGTTVSAAAIGCEQVSGLSTTAPLDTSTSTSTSGTDLTITSSALTTATANEIIFLAGGSYYPGAWTAGNINGSAATIDHQVVGNYAGDGGLAIEHRIISTQLSGSAGQTAAIHKAGDVYDSIVVATFK